MSNFWTPWRDQRLKEFWPTKVPTRVLALELGVSDAYISQRAKLLGLPHRLGRLSELRRASQELKFAGQVLSRNYLEIQAARRNISVVKLTSLLLKTIANDHLVDAILDDAAEIKNIVPMRASI